MSQPVIGFAGMTHLGINSAAAAAARGFQTVCFDTDAGVITKLKLGKLPVVEPGLPELIEQNKQRLCQPTIRVRAIYRAFVCWSTLSRVDWGETPSW